MPRIKKLTMQQTKDRLAQLDAHRFFFFSTTLDALEKVINPRALVLLEKRGKDIGIKVSSIKYPDRLNLVFRERGGFFSPKTIFYGIEFTYGVPEIAPWFIASSVNNLKESKFDLWREKPSFWERIQRKKPPLPRGIDEILKNLNTDHHLQETTTTLLRTAAPFASTKISFECFHKWAKNIRPNLAMVFEFPKVKKTKIGPERKPSAWKEIVPIICDLLLIARTLFERYRARHY
ncbi:MAG: hypothetical protein ACFFB3_10350 [Candidatus Hodarchaeota archaeon]